MAEMNQFGSGVPGEAQVCARCETLLMDALDRTATPEDQSFFDKHLASCVACSRMFMDAQRGAAWLEMLRDPQPEPSATLLARILAQTTASPTTIAPAPAPTLVPQIAVHPVPTRVLPFRPRNAVYTFGQRMLQPRLAMTAAMAFFSIALTLNLTGVHISELSASDLRPTNLRRGFHEANAHVVRYYDNLRVVYELEARVHELQRTSEPEPDPAPKKPDDTKPQRKPGPGSSLRDSPFRDSRSVALLAPPLTAIHPRSIGPATQSKGDRS